MNYSLLNNSWKYLRKSSNLITHKRYGRLFGCALVLTLGLMMLHPSVVKAQAGESTIYLPSLLQPPGEDEPPPDEEPDDSTPFPNEIPPAERLAVIQSIESEINDLLPPPSTDPESRDLLSELKQLSTSLLDNPRVITTILMSETLSLQVILDDSSSIVIANNRPIGNELPEDAASAATEVNAMPSAAAPFSTVPGAPKAVVANFDGGGAVAAEVRTMLSKEGYEIASTGASIVSMRTSYKNLGALYLDTHGASFLQITGVITRANGSIAPQTGEVVYALQTSTDVATTSLLENYLPELRRGEVVVKIVEGDNGYLAKFAITEKFIAKHWSFDEAVVVIHACYAGAGAFLPGATCSGVCSGFDPTKPGVFDPRPLRAAMQANGAEVVMSFDNLTNTGQARPSILFFYDRMLGANSFQATASPPLRPFPSDEVKSAMSTANLLQFNRPKYSGDTLGLTGNIVNVTFDNKGDTAGLAPSVQFVDIVDDADKAQGLLTLTGNFGTKQGTVEVGGVAATIKSWTKEKVEIETPFTGAGATGDLIVKAPDDVESNPTPITEWSGTVTYEQGQDGGPLSVKATIKLKFRADLHPYRTSIDGNPQERTVEVYLSNSSSGAVSASGTVQAEDTRTTWSGGGTLNVLGKQGVDIFAGIGVPTTAAPDAPSADGQMGGIVTLNPTTNTARLCLYINGSYTSTVSGDGQSQSFQQPLFLSNIGGVADGQRGLLTCFNLTLNDNYTIPAGQKNVTIEDAIFKVEWTSMQPTNAPEDATPG